LKHCISGPGCLITSILLSVGLTFLNLLIRAF